MIAGKSKISAVVALIIICLWGAVANLNAQQAGESSAKQNAVAQEPEHDTPEHLLDGTQLEYFYQNGWGIKMAFYDGKLKYEWISGPRKGNHAKDIPYRSRKIGDDMFIVNFRDTSGPDFVTLVINLRENVMCSSVILRYGTDKERIFFHGGIIEHVQRDGK